MKQYKNVLSSATNTQPLEVNVDTVYIRTNIHPVETEVFVGWQYDETQYTYKEYMEILAQQEDVVKLKEENIQLKQENQVLSERLDFTDELMTELIVTVVP